MRATCLGRAAFLRWICRAHQSSPPSSLERRRNNGVRTVMTGGKRPRGSLMAVEEHDMAERQARLEKMLAEFRAAQQRRLVRQGMALWNKTEAAYMVAHAQTGPPPPKMN